MSIKKNLIIGIATGLVGMSLISGGTVAYFSYQEETKSVFKSGKMEFDIKDEDGVLFEFNNIIPGEEYKHTFTITNTGTVDMKDISLYSRHTVENEKVDRNYNIASQIVLKDIVVKNANGNKRQNVLKDNITLAELANRTGTLDASNKPIILLKYLKSGMDAEVEVTFEFVESGKDQNKYQDQTLTLYWTFYAEQSEPKPEQRGNR